MGAIKADPQIRLMVIKGADEGKFFETNQFPILLGRDSCAQLVFKEDKSISRKHALIFSRRGKIVLEDLKSTNGTFVNNVRITRKTELKSGSVFILGNSSIKIIVNKPELKRRSDARQEDANTSFVESIKQEAILVLDQHRSSALADQLGDDEVMRVTEAMNRIALPIASRRKAQFIKGTGDGYLMTFRGPGSALRAAQEMMEAIKGYNKGKRRQKRIHIRIALNHGRCNIEPNGDRHGQAVNVAFRVEGLKYREILKESQGISSKSFPEKDRILISEEFYLKLPSKNKYPMIKYLGRFKLKGIKDPKTIYRYIV